MTTDKRVLAIRADKLVGRGTCSAVDECMSDSELTAMLDECGITTVKNAVKFARDHEQIHLEQGLNARWGEDDDPQLTDYRDFKDRRKDDEK